MSRSNLLSFIFVIFIFIGNNIDGENTHKKDIWEEVKRRAEEASGGNMDKMWRKHIWRELKKLKPEDLITCGEKVCIEAVRDKWDLFGLYMTTNAILSYHAKKTGWDETAKEIGTIILQSENPQWVECSLAWFETNDHYKEISAKGMSSVAGGINTALKDKKKAIELKRIILKSLSSSFWISFPDKDKTILKKTIVELAKNAKELELRKYAKKSLRLIEYTEWDYRREQGIKPLGKRPSLEIEPEKQEINLENLEPNIFIDKDGKEKSIFQFSVVDGKIPPVFAMKRLNRSKSIPELIKVLKTEKDPHKVSTAAYVLSYFKEKRAVPILVDQIRSKYSGEIGFIESLCCIEMIECLGRLSRDNDEAFNYLKKFLQFDYWDGIRWRMKYGSNSATKTRLVISSVIALNYSKRKEAIKILEDIKDKAEYQQVEELKWRINNAISNLKELRAN